MASQQSKAVRRAKVSANLKRQLRALLLLHDTPVPEELDAPVLAGRDGELKNIIELERVNKVLSLVTGEPEDVNEGTLQGGPGPEEPIEEDAPLTRAALSKLSKADLLQLAEKKGLAGSLKRDATVAELRRALSGEE